MQTPTTGEERAGSAYIYGLRQVDKFDAGIVGTSKEQRNLQAYALRPPALVGWGKGHPTPS
jgi:hypothetical protein